MDNLSGSVFDDFLGRYQDNGGINEQKSALVSIPLPALSLRYLFRQEGFPLSRTISIFGPADSQKTSLAIEIIRWHRLCGGAGLLIHTEGKPPDELVYGILNNDMDAIRMVQVQSLEDWMRCVRGTFDSIIQASRRKRGTLPERPVCVVVDTISGILDESEIKEIDKSGAPRVHFASMAKKISDHFRDIPRLLWQYPFTYVCINHLKFASTGFGPSIPYSPGGESINYATSMRLFVRRSSGTTITASPEHQILRQENNRIYYGNVLVMDMTKNSIAPRSSLEEVEFVWYYDYDNPKEIRHRGKVKVLYPQVMYFDWYAASVSLLDRLYRQRNMIGQRLRDLFDLQTINDKNKRVAWSNSLGISEESSLTWTEFGRYLEEYMEDNDDFRESLYGILGIHLRPFFDPDIPYSQQLEKSTNELLGFNEENLNG